MSKDHCVLETVQYKIAVESITAFYDFYVKKDHQSISKKFQYPVKILKDGKVIKDEINPDVTNMTISRSNTWAGKVFETIMNPINTSHSKWAIDKNAVKFDLQNLQLKIPVTQSDIIQPQYTEETRIVFTFNLKEHEYLSQNFVKQINGYKRKSSFNLFGNCSKRGDEFIYSGQSICHMTTIPLIHSINYISNKKKDG